MAEARWHRTETTPLAEPSIRRLHRRAITDAWEVAALLQRVCDEGVTLRNGVDRRNSNRSARVAWVRADTVCLRSENISPNATQLYLSFELSGTAYFFACNVGLMRDSGDVLVDLPKAIYEAERRDLRRLPVSSNGPGSTRVELEAPEVGRSTIAKIRDRSYDGLGVSARPERFLEPGTDLVVRFLDGSEAGQEAYATVRHKRPEDSESGWERFGLSVTKSPINQRIDVEARQAILSGGISARAWRRVVLAGAQMQAAPRRIARQKPALRKGDARVVEYSNNLSQRIVGLLDRSEARGRGTAVLIPPSWGRTKETFLPLARTIVRTFEASNEPVTILRFDGTNRRGESFVDPGCRRSGDEYLKFKFSQAVNDIHASVRFLQETVAPRNIVLVTFSLASIEGRRAVATDASGLLAGWISVVGMVDLQSGLRSVSGGVDYAYGLLEGVAFGRHELVGVLSDMDLTGHDALENSLVFLEDARRDMARIRIPVSWLHGRHDAWMDLGRVVTLMSAGEISGRRLMEIPTGHELRSSREALETFQLVATEAGRISLGRSLKPVLPSLADISRRRDAERARIPRVTFEAERFWREYVLGREGQGGIRLLTATDAYRSLMKTQIELLDLKPGAQVVDLGSGTGELATTLRNQNPTIPLQVVEVDIVKEALRGSRTESGSAPDVRVLKIAADLDFKGGSLPLKGSSADRLLASLLLSYLDSPHHSLVEILRVLRPGGVAVISSLRRDADISKIYTAGIAELQADRVADIFGANVAARFETLQREFLNSASRLLDLEEGGRFRFYDEEELVALLEAAGFVGVASRLSFGEPAQAVVVSGRRP